jgi:hypothetical protein
MESKKPNQA